MSMPLRQWGNPIAIMAREYGAAFYITCLLKLEAYSRVHFTSVLLFMVYPGLGPSLRIHIDLEIARVLGGHSSLRHLYVHSA